MFAIPKFIFSTLLSLPFFLLAEYSFSMRDQFEYSYVISCALLFIFFCVFFPVANFFWRIFFRDRLSSIPYIICISLLFFFLALSSLHQDSKFEVEHYIYPTGNCNFFISWALKKKNGKLSVSPLGKKPYSFLYRTWRNIEDHCRYEKLNYLFTHNFSKPPKLCKRFTTNDPYLCFSDLRTKITHTSPYSKYGFIKAQMISSKLLSKDPHNKNVHREFGPKDSNILLKLMGYDRMLQILEAKMYLRMEELMNPHSAFTPDDLSFNYQEDVLNPIIKEKSEHFKKFAPSQWMAHLKESLKSLWKKNHSKEIHTSSHQKTLDKQLKEINKLLNEKSSELNKRERELLESIRDKYLEVKHPHSAN